ncbi:MAG: ABC transporter permease, partial [Dokdonella sp.]|nr:ABC transporter permease [Dokdonella sp.]
MNAISSLLRRQLRTPLFALIVTVLVAAVVAFNASAFSAIHALRWKALPYVDGERLVELQARLVNYGFDVGLTENLRQAVIADTAHFSGALGVARVRGGGEDGRTWQMARVTENFQQVLGIAPALGRGFQADDARAGNDAVILLGDAIWRSRFNADPQVIGKDIRFTDRVYRVIGVMPPSFAFPDASIEAWRPFVMSDAERELNRQGNVGMIDVVARMAPGV